MDTVTESSPWEEISFRGEYNWQLTALNDNKIVFQKSRNMDPYFYAFLEALTYRDNCYECPYARKERVGDITIGDFWGIERKKLKNQYDGKISLVLLNTDSGRKYWEKCKENFVWEKRKLQEAINEEQGNLNHASLPHRDRRKFIINYSKVGFLEAVMKTSIGKEIKRREWKKQIKENSLVKFVRKLKAENK